LITNQVAAVESLAFTSVVSVRPITPECSDMVTITAEVRTGDNQGPYVLGNTNPGVELLPCPTNGGRLENSISWHHPCRVANGWDLGTIGVEVTWRYCVND
jgi:hypothetical protein